MIRATLARGGKSHARDFDDVDAFASFLEKEAEAGGEVFVRVADDATLLQVEAAYAHLHVGAQKRVQLIAGAQGFYWAARDPLTGHMLLFPDAGGGWRLRLVGMTLNSQGAQMPKNGAVPLRRG